MYLRLPVQLKRIAIMSYVLLLSACTFSADIKPDPELQRLSSLSHQVTIIRDDFGVPHIYGKTDANVVFGLLYAQAEDDFNRVEHNYIWAIGRLAEVEGEAAIFSDLRARLYMTIDEAKAAYQSAPVWLKKLCDAYADGLNYYLLTHPEVTPNLITHFEPWMPMFFSEGSIGGDIESISVKGIEAFYGAGKSLPTPALAQIRQANFKEPRGSNGFAISGEHTLSGNAMLLINPHTSFYFRGEVHVVSEEGLNAYGAVTWGQFFVYQGFNEKTGWMHTSTRLDFMDEFVEDVSKQNGKLVYKYGKELRPVKVSSVTLRYKDGEGFSSRTFPMYHTHHGPVTHMLNGKWTVTKINWDPVNALRQSYIRTKLSNHHEFDEMMKIRTNSSNNTVFADAEGNIAYYHGNFVPIRNTRFDYSKPVDGSNPETDWMGVHPLSELITLLNPPNGWIQNCNSTPFTAAAEYSPKRGDYPYYMAPDAENFRGIHAQAVLENAKDLDLDKLIALAYDPYLPGFKQLISGLIKAYDESDQSAHQDATEVLRSWNLTSSLDSVAMTLAHFYGTEYLRSGKNPMHLSRSDLIDSFGTSSPYSERLAVFARTLQKLNSDYGSWHTPWGDINRFQRINGDILQPHDDAQPSLAVSMASGRWGALASFGARAYSNTKKIYGSSGNSFVAVVEFGKKVRAKTLLAGGQSGHPDSKHFLDQAQAYVHGRFKEVAFYKEDVEQRAQRTYHPGHPEGD